MVDNKWAVRVVYGTQLEEILEKIFDPTLLNFKQGAFEREILKISLYILGEEKIIRIIKKGIRKLGRQIYECYFRNGVAQTYSCYADHVISPAALAYALAEGEFSEEEKRRIRFDHGEDPVKYVTNYYDWRYPYTILEERLAWKEPEPPPITTDGHCCC